MLKKLLKILAIILILPYPLVLIYSFVPPISLPIIGETVTFKEVHWRWRSYNEISPNLAKAIIGAEDGRFCVHNGVDWQAIQEAVKKAEKKGKLANGASTIAMQNSKNLFLWFYPDIMRKPLEVPLSMWMDLIWSKQRMIEVYMNIAEMGNGIYGAEAASQKYFGKPASRINPYEASLIAASLPNPTARKASERSRVVNNYSSVIRKRANQVMVSCLKK